jgi:imidazolonepropionase-like amidohydrolase
MVKRLWIIALAGALAGCRPGAQGLGPRYKLEGFTLVDPGARVEAVKDLWVVDGALATAAPPGAQDWPVLKGRGRWLLPGLQDLGVASWGNDSAKDFKELSQPMGADALLKAQLYAGVTRVTVTMGAHGLKHSRFGDGLRRIEAFGIPCAHGGVASPYLMGPGGGGFFAVTVGSRAELDRVLAVELAEPLDYLQMSGESGQAGKPGRGLAPDPLRAAIARGHAAGLRSAVMVSDAPQARAALAAGADALMGGPWGAGSPAVFKAMARRGCVWLSSPGALDLVDAPDPGGVRGDALAQALVDPRILDSFADVGAYWPVLAQARAQVTALTPAFQRALAQAAEAKVPLWSVSQAGWTATSFQGVGIHRALLALGRGGVPAWVALASATTVPAAFLGRRCGFKDGDPADLLALDADPVADLANTERISGVCIAGAWPEREGLKPDLWRHHY